MFLIYNINKSHFIKLLSTTYQYAAPTSTYVPAKKQKTNPLNQDNVPMYILINSTGLRISPIPIIVPRLDCTDPVYKKSINPAN